MCDPTMMFVASVATSALGGYAQYQAQSQQAAYQNRLAIATAENAKQATINDYNQSALRDAQEEAAAAQQVQAGSREAARARATLRTSAGEAGVAGVSLAALERDFYAQELRNQDVINQNLRWQRQQAGMDRKSIHSTGVSRRNQAASSMMARPSFLGTALQVGGDVMTAGNKYLGWGE